MLDHSSFFQISLRSYNLITSRRVVTSPATENMSEGNVNEQDLPLLESSENSTTHELPTVWCCMLVMVLISMSYAFSEAPLYRLYESRICVGYWLEHDSTVIDSHGNVPEDKCKLPFIQTDLAMFQSNQVLYNTITCTTVLQLRL